VIPTAQASSFTLQHFPYYVWCSEYYYYYYYYLLTYLLQLSCHSVTALLTPVQTKQIRINIYKEKIQTHSTKHAKYSTQGSYMLTYG
jgi:hypothetical protein